MSYTFDFSSSFGPQNYQPSGSLNYNFLMPHNYGIRRACKFCSRSCYVGPYEDDELGYYCCADCRKKQLCSSCHKNEPMARVDGSPRMCEACYKDHICPVCEEFRPGHSTAQRRKVSLINATTRIKARDDMTSLACEICRNNRYCRQCGTELSFMEYEQGLRSICKHCNKKKMEKAAVQKKIKSARKVIVSRDGKKMLALS